MREGGREGGREERKEGRREGGTGLDFMFSSATCSPSIAVPSPPASGHRQHAVRDAASQWGPDEGECGVGKGLCAVSRVTGSALEREQYAGCTSTHIPSNFPPFTHPSSFLPSCTLRGLASRHSSPPPPSFQVRNVLANSDLDPHMYSALAPGAW